MSGVSPSAPYANTESNGKEPRLVYQLGGHPYREKSKPRKYTNKGFSLRVISWLKLVCHRRYRFRVWAVNHSKEISEVKMKNIIKLIIVAFITTLPVAAQQPAVVTSADYQRAE